ncbi:type I polyketide synthase, partial [Kitasatospora sp. NPDC057500]|uniref:type I polyketide synthase n=1 Tax=Kitasatospora sp. NPDC057500 TaxID=3346151 RepID=UPI0036A70524
THVLNTLQTWLTDERFTTSRLLIATRGAVATDNTTDINLAHTPVWGLVRSAQAENPGRIQLTDLDTTSDPATALTTHEPETALRHNTIHIPRLHRLTPQPTTTNTTFDPEGTILITGGTGGLGAVIARHLATHHGARHLVLASRTGTNTPTTTRLLTELAELGTHAHATTCDVTDRQALATLITDITTQRPLVGIVHAAGSGNNALTTALTPQHLDTALAPKADGAWHLHQLTQHLDLTAFILISSAGGLVLTAGQGNYAAANVFLDGLATHRRANGLPATSMAFALWDTGTGMSRHLNDIDRTRMTTQGLPPLTHDQGLTLFTQALHTHHTTVAPLRINPTTLRTRTDTIPALLRTHNTHPTHNTRTPRTTTPPTWPQQLTHLTPQERHRTILQAVRTEIATVLGHTTPDTVEPDRAFKELGFDSLAATELRNHLNTLTGLHLPATLAFDHPTALAITHHLTTQLWPTHTTTPPPDIHDHASHGEPIAIIGMACRYPGGITTPEELWQLVLN